MKLWILTAALLCSSSAHASPDAGTFARHEQTDLRLLSAKIIPQNLGLNPMTGDTQTLGPQALREPAAQNYIRPEMMIPGTCQSPGNATICSNPVRR